MGLASAGGAADAGARPLLMGAVTLKPEAFVPLLPTTTHTITSTATSAATSTSSATSIGTSTNIASASSPAGADQVDQQAPEQLGSGPAWWWFVVGAAVAGGAVAACALVVQKKRQKSVEVAGSQV